MSVFVDEVEWKRRFYDLVGYSRMMNLTQGDNLGGNHSTSFIGDEFVMYASKRGRHEGLFYFYVKERRVLVDSNLPRLARRMCELLPDLRAQLSLFPGAYIPPPGAAWDEADPADKERRDLMHDNFGLLRGDKYTFEVLYAKFAAFLHVRGEEGGGELEEEELEEVSEEEVSEEETMWRTRLYDLLGSKASWLKNCRTSSELPNRFRHVFTRNRGERVDGKLVIYIVRSENGCPCLDIKNRQIVGGCDLVQISRRMCELIPGMYAALKRFQAGGLYCPPEPAAEWKFGDIPDTDPLHSLGLLRGIVYPCKFVYEMWCLFLGVSFVPGGGVAGGGVAGGGVAGDAGRDEEEEKDSRMKDKLDELHRVSEEFSKSQSAEALRFIEMVIAGDVFRSGVLAKEGAESDEPDGQLEHVSFGNMGKAGEAVSNLFARLVAPRRTFPSLLPCRPTSSRRLKLSLPPRFAPAICSTALSGARPELSSR